MAGVLGALALSCAVVSTAPFTQQPPATLPANSPWAEWVEPDFPFFSSVIDGGRAGTEFPVRNLTPRGLVLNLGRGYWVGFDTDLVRVAAMWRGTVITSVLNMRMIPREGRWARYSSRSSEVLPAPLAPVRK